MTDNYEIYLGLNVPVPAVTLLLDLEARGFTVRVDTQDNALWVTPPAPLTPADVAAIRRYKSVLIPLISRFEPPTPHT